MLENFLEQNEIKLDDISTLDWQIWRFVSVVTTFPGLNVRNQHRSKGTHWTRTMANSMLS